MTKSVQLLLLFLIACTVSLSASVLDRPATSFMASESFTGTTNSHFSSVDLVREFRADSVSFTPALCCDRPMTDQNVTAGTVSGSDTSMPITLDRPQFSSRFISNNDPVQPTPEPASLVLLASGFLSGAYFVRRRK